MRNKNTANIYNTVEVGCLIEQTYCCTVNAIYMAGAVIGRAAVRTAAQLTRERRETGNTYIPVMDKTNPKTYSFPTLPAYLRMAALCGKTSPSTVNIGNCPKGSSVGGIA